MMNAPLFGLWYRMCTKLVLDDGLGNLTKFKRLSGDGPSCDGQGDFPKPNIPEPNSVVVFYLM